MTRSGAKIALGMCGVFLLTAVGCAEKKVEPVMVPDQGAADRQRIADLQTQLQQAQRDRAGCQDEIVRLQNELNKLREQLAKRAEPASPAAGWESVPGGAMTSIEGTILFDSGKAVLKAGAKKMLDEVARAIKEKFPEAEIYVFGHTDSTPIKVSGWKDNYELSCQRALSVVRFLSSAGVRQNAAACGWGERRPVAANANERTRQANRRVEIFAMSPQAAKSGATGGAPPSPEQ